MSTLADIQTLNPGAVWEGYVLEYTDPTTLVRTVYYLTSGLNPLKTNVVWQGNTYQAIPIAASGFEASTQGQLPTPTLSVANLDGLVGGLVDSYQDLVGWILTRKQVLVQYLDAANFPGGNANANPNEGTDDVWAISQKTLETADTLSFTLVAKSDAMGHKIPHRQMISTTCPSAYANADGTGMCPYTGGIADCDHTLNGTNGCKVHFPTGKVPFGGFPGLQGA